MTMAARLRLALLLSVCLCSAWARPRTEPAIRLPSERAAAAAGEGADDVVGTRWAVLIAGSNGYYNYRHQVRAAPRRLSEDARRELRSSGRLLNPSPSSSRNII
jgi:legumain